VLKTLAGLVAELRAVGIPVSPTEHIDAAAALSHTALEDRAAVKAALSATLVKNTEHWQAFSTVFDLYFAGRRRDLDDPSTRDGDSGEPSDSEGMPEGGIPGAGSLGGLSDEELAELLYRALRDNNRLIQRAIAAQLVTRHSGMEPGRRVAGTYYLFKALRPVRLEAILERLREENEATDESALDKRLKSLEYAGRVDGFRNEVESEIRERMVADRGPEDVARTLRRPLPEDIDFLNATRADATAIREALKPLARKLAARLARKRRARRDAPLDFRHTMRRSLSTGGTPVELVFRKPHPSRPDLIVLADISGSVATFASFTLQLVYALRSEFAKVRCFVFVDGIEDITEMMEKADNLAEVTHRINRGSSAVWLNGRSDYGHALRTFERRWGDQVRSRSTVIVLGDARNNYLAARDESLGKVAERARNLYWLNPEPMARWNDGDSIIDKYALHCDGVFECRNVRQLRQFVEGLD
jgi:uncharacterized protein with von Willebrand factor type A (vWA) domain